MLLFIGRIFLILKFKFLNLLKFEICFFLIWFYKWIIDNWLYFINYIYNLSIFKYYVSLFLICMYNVYKDIKEYCYEIWVLFL